MHPLQFGFRPKQDLDCNKLAFGAFVDCPKEFDNVNHNILMSKLNHYGIRGVENDWVSSYLSNRLRAH